VESCYQIGIVTLGSVAPVVAFKHEASMSIYAAFPLETKLVMPMT